MRRPVTQALRGLVLAALLPALASAQTTPATAADSLKPVPTFAVDTTRLTSVVAVAPEPSEQLTRPTALRITAAIVLLTLTTLVLYNVRSR